MCIAIVCKPGCDVMNFGMDFTKARKERITFEITHNLLKQKNTLQRNYNKNTTQVII